MKPMHNERRQTLRYPVKLDIDLVLEDGTILTVQTINISHNGLQFSCDSIIANEIEPRGIHSHSTDHLKMKVVATFPMGDENKKFYASCQVIAARRLSQENFLLGLEFYDFEKSSDKVLKNYIDLLSTGKSG